MRIGCPRRAVHAQPYDISAVGFYFHTSEEYTTKADALRNDYGDPVEEFEIQFIDGQHIDCELASAWHVSQANFASYFEAVEEWDIDQKQKYIIAVGECGYSHDQYISDPDAIEIELYQIDSMKEHAEQFVDEGLFGEVPNSLQFYIDYDAVARDLGFDYSEIVITDKTFIYSCS